MGLFIFSVVVSMIVGGIVWLVIGDRLPFRERVKWDSRKNFLCYVAISFLGIFLLGFFLF